MDHISLYIDLIYYPLPLLYNSYLYTETDSSYNFNQAYIFFIIFFSKEKIAYSRLIHKLDYIFFLGYICKANYIVLNYLIFWLVLLDFLS